MDIKEMSHEMLRWTKELEASASERSSSAAEGQLEGKRKQWSANTPSIPQN